jgi:hypothetical protein
MLNENLLFQALVMSIGGLYTLWQGWIRLRNPAGYSADLFEPITLTLSRLLQGEIKAAQVRAQLRQPDKVRRTGYYALVGGAGLLISGGLSLLAAIISANR